jgi:hypothetical protein
MEQEISFALASGVWLIILIIGLWSLIWKGIALWYSAKRNDKWWFIVLLVVNLAGLLEIFYLAFVVKLWSKKNVMVTPPFFPDPASTPTTTATPPPNPIAGTPVVPNIPTSPITNQTTTTTTPTPPNPSPNQDTSPKTVTEFGGDSSSPTS